MQKIFFIEDDLHLSRMYERVFRLNDCDVLTCADGGEGLKALQSMDPLPSAIVLDAILPTMNGEDILKAIKSNPRLAAIPVVVLTNTLQPEWRERFLAGGADHFLIKMDTATDEIVAVVTKLINEKSRIAPTTP